ncbi:dTDP-4-dehydrorhamnose reductase [Neobacillus mesonae]|uniref:dTDP-4-dehydrorhamnose reductase n=1 Tax=Neobacillus mesonae TaxID=1193713 RepID=UPI00203EC597|nr:dTDP-4-dehydrorhamnose reductase [Neobacillus mesonae]MCM3571046.1 dTDP-4-dehydrorhamnose reductase [Neobacillus mesonae]
MKILVTGANGQLGKEVIKQFSSSYDMIGYGKEELDITNLNQVISLMQKERPDLIIHTAAYTAVDECEINKLKAMEVNALGAANVAKAASAIEAKMFYISSDYVFSGKKQKPYMEDDSPDPISMYGLSKYTGELLVQHILPSSTIIRTSWLYGHNGRNFVNTMLQFAKSHTQVKVVNDQVGSPTYTADLVKIMTFLLDKPHGIYHVTNLGECSWYQFAKRIYELAGSDPELVKACSTEDFGSLAKRPSFSCLAHEEIKAHNIPLPPDWETALKAFIRKEQAND